MRGKAMLCASTKNPCTRRAAGTSGLATLEAESGEMCVRPTKSRTHKRGGRVEGELTAETGGAMMAPGLCVKGKEMMEAAGICVFPSFSAKLFENWVFVWSAN